jgi:hypothetical protein
MTRAADSDADRAAGTEYVRAARRAQAVGGALHREMESRRDGLYLSLTDFHAAFRCTTPCPLPVMHSRTSSMVVAASVLTLTACGAKRDAPTTVISEPVPPVYLQPAAKQLPLVSIATADGNAIVSKTVYVPATLTLADSTGTTVLQGAMDVRGHGYTMQIYYLRGVSLTDAHGCYLHRIGS